MLAFLMKLWHNCHTLLVTFYITLKTPESKIKINESIRSPELRVIDDEKGNLGVISLEEALRIAHERGLDLIEISPEAVPPVAKIMDYGKFQYLEKKKLKIVKQKAHTTEVKSVQIKTGTGEGDIATKAKRADEWLNEGHRVKVELFLSGRSKGLDKDFLKERLVRFLDFVKTPFDMVEDFRQIPKGFELIIEKKRIKTN